jgi:hypothetical protein
MNHSKTYQEIDRKTQFVQRLTNSLDTSKHLHAQEVLHRLCQVDKKYQKNEDLQLECHHRTFSSDVLANSFLPMIPSHNHRDTQHIHESVNIQREEVHWR